MTQGDEERGDAGGATGEPAAPQPEATGDLGDQGPPEPTVEEQVGELQERADRLLANWQRAQADLANYRKQVERDREDLVRRASASLLIDLLPIMDDLERALGNVSESLRGLTWVDGVVLIYRKLEAVLGLQGVEALVTEPGEALDPRRHQAVAEVEGEEGKIVAVIQKGYTLRQQLLRPALVAVGRPAADPAAEPEASPPADSLPVDDDPTPEPSPS